jgi:dolichol-phosphate mannosyltransferase
MNIAKIKGPILVLGASGFVGANLFRLLLANRNDVFGTTSNTDAWRLDGIDASRIIVGDLLFEGNLEKILNEVKPQTVFNFTAYGAYHFEEDINLIYQTNITFTTRLIEELFKRNIACFINAGSSSEYGNMAAAPTENSALNANSHYSVTKATISNLIYFYGKSKNMPTINLRLYSVYGPYEDSSRLVPNLILHGINQKLPHLVNANISRDFIYIDDVCEAFIDAAVSLNEKLYGESFNIGSEVKTTIGEIATLAREIFNIKEESPFNAKEHKWDVEDWYANCDKAKKNLNWQAKTKLKDGLIKTTQHIKENLALYQSPKSTKKPFGDLDKIHSISCIIACYKDSQAIPEMYERITCVMQKLKLDYEIIFVNDASPDDSELVISKITQNDPRVLGITHSRNFGSQAAFKSGLEMASKNACVLMDGDLQDPPEMIEEFLEKWREGYEVIYGRRVGRKAPFYMKILYKFFYRVFAAFSYITIPKDAGDFALMDKKVVKCLLQFPERDLFLRGMRAYAGFKQTGVDYIRPERKFGRTTNNLFKNIGWAKKGIFSFSYLPLNILSAFGWAMLCASILMIIAQILIKIFYPESSPHGITTILILITFFGSLNLFAISIIGEYIAKIFEEVKARPHFIRKSIIKRGNIINNE